MRVRAIATGLAACLTAGLVVVPGVAEARVLLEDRGVEVSMDQLLRCGEPARVNVTAERADLFRETATLQALVDATRAILGYECRQIPEIQITGLVRGYAGTQYEGTAGPASEWRLRPGPGYAAAAPAPAPAPAPPPVATAPAWSPPPAAPAAPTARYAVRNLTTGMTVDAALDEARRSFDTTPRYDAKRREMTVVLGNCDVSSDARPRAGWVCMKTLFTEGRDPRAYRLSYSQVVDRDQGEAIAAQLRQRFGQPVVDEQRRSSNWLQGGAPDRRLAWGNTTRGPEGESRHELEASIRVDPDVTVLTLDLLDPGLLAAAPRYRVQF